MSREIKFRLRIGNKIIGYEKWYSGSFGETCSASPRWLYSRDNKYWSPNYIYHKDKNQYAGLEDKNNKEIYEGDIVKNFDGINGYVKWVIFCPARTLRSFEVATTRDVLQNMYSWTLHNDCEVIGNIYENPELLKQ